MKKISIDHSNVKSQKDIVMWHLERYGSITSMKAFEEYGITRLSSIILRIKRDGYRIESEHITNRKNRFGNKVSYSKYTYKDPSNE